MDKVNDEFVRANFWNLATARWFGWRLDVVAWSFLAVTAMGAVGILGEVDFVTVSLVGLSLSMTLQLSSSFQWAVRQSAEVENYMISTERLLQYTDLVQEPPLSFTHDPLENIMSGPSSMNNQRLLCCSSACNKGQDGVIRSSGEKTSAYQNTEELDQSIRSKAEQNGESKYSLELSNLCVRYRKELDFVLDSVSARICKGEKLGVVGRTGSGKSTLVLALFRLVEADSDGSIFINGRDIAHMGLHDLRNMISIIPQEPVMFTGSVRSNLDPFAEYEDKALWAALQSATLLECVSGLEGKLEATVDEGGSNFSVGQRQLFCLARAILRNNEVLVLDEATSNVDVATDRTIQKVIRSKFARRTIVTIAHRLDTIIDCDRILVLDRGKVEELDTPYNLLKKYFAEVSCEDSKKLTKSANLTKKHGFASLVLETGTATARALWRKVS
jgi:ABC-type multidrug transport system fused ATPase/permease subunit